MTRPKLLAFPPFWGVAVFVGVLFTLFIPTFAKLYNIWDADPSYSHGYLILPLSIYLAVLRYRQAGPPNLSEGNLPQALSALLIGTFFHELTVVLSWVLFDWIALIFLVRGLLIGLGGPVWAARFTFPLLFLFFMFPLPMAWTTYLAIWLQDVVARLSTNMLEPFFLVVREGKAIRIEGVSTPLIVAHECSGVRQLVMFVAVAAFLGEWALRPIWARLLLIVAALPVAVLANSLRVMMMAMGSVWFDIGWINTGLHDVPAYLSLPIGCLLFLGVHAGIGRLCAENLPKPAAGPSVAADGAGSLARSWRCLILAGTMVGVFALNQGLKAHIEIEGKKPAYAEFREPLESLRNPLVIGGQNWYGSTPASINNDLLSKIDFRYEDLLFRQYRNEAGASFSIYAVFSQSAGDRYHHPEHCIRDAQGGTEDLAARRRVFLSSPLRQAQYFRFRVGWSNPMSVYYWHYTFVPPADSGLTLLQKMHRSIGRTAPSLTVEVFTNETDPAILATLERDLMPQLDDLLYQHHLPASAIGGCQRFPVVILR